MVGDGRRAVVIHGTALVCGVEILHHHALQPLATSEPKLASEQYVFQGIEVVTVGLSLLIVGAFAIAIIVEMKLLGMVLKEMVGIHRHAPCRCVVVDTGEPRAALVSLYIAIAFAIGDV